MIKRSLIPLFLISLGCRPAAPQGGPQQIKTPVAKTIKKEKAEAETPANGILTQLDGHWKLVATGCDPGKLSESMEFFSAALPQGSVAQKLELKNGRGKEIREIRPSAEVLCRLEILMTMNAQEANAKIEVSFQRGAAIWEQVGGAKECHTLGLKGEPESSNTVQMTKPKPNITRFSYDSEGECGKGGKRFLDFLKTQ